MISWAMAWLSGLIQAGRVTVRRAIVFPLLASFAKIEAETDAEVAAVLAELDNKSPKTADALRAAIAQFDVEQQPNVLIPESSPKPVKQIGRPRKKVLAESQPGQNIPKP